MPKIMSRSDLRVAGISYSDASLYRLEAAGMFPRRRKLGLRKVGWVADEIRTYLKKVAA
jgi:predicted DNA-binding transcriptional regulator AlpA